MAKKKAKRAAKKSRPDGGRDGKGRFVPGNKLSTGATNHKALIAAKQFKAAFASVVTTEDMRKIGRKLVKMATAGDLMAVKELFDRLFGKAPQAISLKDDREIEQPATVEELREALAEAEAMLKEAHVIQLQVNHEVA